MPLFIVRFISRSFFFIFLFFFLIFFSHFILGGLSLSWFIFQFLPFPYFCHPHFTPFFLLLLPRNNLYFPGIYFCSFSSLFIFLFILSSFHYLALRFFFTFFILSLESFYFFLLYFCFKFAFSFICSPTPILLLFSSRVISTHYFLSIFLCIFFCHPVTIFLLILCPIFFIYIFSLRRFYTFFFLFLNVRASLILFFLSFNSAHFNGTYL